MSRKSPAFLALGLNLIKLSPALSIGTSPVTRAQYRAITGKDPAYSLADLNAPVERVSWINAQGAAMALNNAEFAPPGYEYRLPTLAERRALALAIFPGKIPLGSVHSLSPQHPAGFVGLRGLLWEWTADRDGKTAIAAGSSFLDWHLFADAAHPEISLPTDTRWHTLGFRLALAKK